MPGATAHAQSRAEPSRLASVQQRRPIIAALTGLTLLAAALHLPFLGTQSFWFDETYTVHVVGARSLGQLWDRIGATESTPPLYYLLTWGWVHLVGDHGEATMRTVSALAAIAAVPVTYVALRRLVGSTSALATAALLAVSPLLGWYALDARAYGLMILVGLLSVWACSAALEKPTTRRLGLWALTAAAAIWTHWFAGFLVLGEVVALLWLAPAARRRVLIASGAVLVALLPLAELLHDQTGDDRAAFIGNDSLGSRIEQLVRQFAAGPNVPRSWLEGLALAIALGALLAGTAITLRRARGEEAGPEIGSRATASERDGARALLAISLVALLVPLLLAISGIYDRFNVRNVLFLLPLAAALAATMLRAHPVSLAVILAAGVFTTLWVQTDWRYENADWRSAIHAVEVAAPQQPVVVVSPLGQPVAAHYLGRAVTAMRLATRHAQLLVEPARTPGHRALAATDAPVVTSLLAAFASHHERRLHGFRLIELDAPTPVPLVPAQLPGAVLFAPWLDRHRSSRTTTSR